MLELYGMVEFKKFKSATLSPEYFLPLLPDFMRAGTLGQINQNLEGPKNDLKAKSIDNDSGSSTSLRYTKQLNLISYIGANRGGFSQMMGNLPFELATLATLIKFLIYVSIYNSTQIYHVNACLARALALL